MKPHLEIDRWHVWPHKLPFDLITRAEKDGYRGFGFVVGLYHIGSIWLTLWLPFTPNRGEDE